MLGPNWVPELGPSPTPKECASAMLGVSCSSRGWHFPTSADVSFRAVLTSALRCCRNWAPAGAWNVALAPSGQHSYAQQPTPQTRPGSSRSRSASTRHHGSVGVALRPHASSVPQRLDQRLWRHHVESGLTELATAARIASSGSAFMFSTVPCANAATVPARAPGTGDFNDGCIRASG